MTVEPYVIANNLPYSLVSNFLLTDTNAPQEASAYFFQAGRFSNRTILVAWEHSNIPLIMNALLGTCNSVSNHLPLSWGGTDYDSIWTVKLDSMGNLTIDNSICEGIDSTKLPIEAPLF